MSLRRILPIAALTFAFLPFAVGCAATDEGTEDISEEGAAETPAAKQAAKDPTGRSSDGTTTDTPAPRAPKAPRQHAGPPPPPQQLPASPIEFAAQRAEMVKSIVDGAPADGVTSFVLDRGADLPLIFRVASSAVKEIADGFEVHGNLTLETPVGPLSLFAADIVFERGASGGLERLVGSVEIPAPSLGVLEGFETDSPIRGTIGYDTGKNLKEKLEAPMLDTRKYLAFDYSVGLSASAGSASISFAGGKSGTLVLDPSDPSFYLTGGLVGLDAVGPLEDLALGLSARGLLAFEPQVTWGAEDEAKPFSGHIYGKGTLNLKRIPVSIDGEVVINIDPTGQGRLLGTGTPEGVQLGANGQINLTFDARVASIKLPLAKGTVGARLTMTEQHAYVSGDIGPDTDWLPTVMPFVPQAKAKVAAYLDSSFERSHLAAEAEFTLKANKLYSVLPATASLGLKDIPVAKANLTADKNGLRVLGTVTSPDIPVIKPKATLVAEGMLPSSDPASFFFVMSGDFSLGDFPLGAASARIDKQGFTASGMFKTPVTEIAMKGSITQSGASIDGTVAVDLEGLREVAQTVTDGAVCGYDYVRDGSICGYETARDTAICGSEYVKDGTLCGYDYVTDGAVCGYKTVTDGAVCGWDTVSGCLGGIFTSGSTDGCKSAKSCSVPKSCNIARSCTVGKQCTVPKSCQKAKTCETKVNIPDASFGRFEGNLHVEVTSNKAAGSVSGKICSGSSCSSIGGARVELGANPKVCFTGLSGAVGEICGKL